MRIYLERNKLVFFGTVRELRAFLKSLSGDNTLQQLIADLFH